jgi:hypothetical protein
MLMGFLLCHDDRLTVQLQNSEFMDPQKDGKVELTAMYKSIFVK